MSGGKIDGASIAEQVLAGIVVAGVAVAVTHAYDTYRTKHPKKPRKGK